MPDHPKQSSASDKIVFDRAFGAEPGRVERLAPLVRRLVAPNGGPFTFTGTCSYIIGNGRVAILDPGPADERHVAALLAVIEGEILTHIVVTHTHRDHSPAAAMLKAETGAPIWGCTPYRPARSADSGDGALDAANDRDYAPDRVMADGEVLRGDGFTLAAVTTPGHAANHLAFALAEERSLFSGDHVMAWSTTVVAPPDGSMRDYMASLEKLRRRDDAIYWPGHGGPVKEPQRYLRALIHHRRQREAAILARLAAGDTDIATIVAHIYEGLDPRLRGAAALSVLAHMEDLVERGLVVCAGPPRLEARFAPGRGG